MAKYRIICLRHGESQWNKDNLFCGWHDIGLSNEGVQDAKDVSAVALQKINYKFGTIFTSCLMRANQTVNIILETLGLNESHVNIVKDWRLNERHYGDLTGFNKRQMAEKYGEQQVQEWRRKFNVLPPPMLPTNPYYEPIRSNPIFNVVPQDRFPDTESLETTMYRVVEFWNDTIVPALQSGKQVLIVAHGTSLRGLVKYVKSKLNLLIDYFFH